MTIKVNVHKMVEVASYTQGCIGPTQDFGIVETKLFKDIQDALKFCQSFGKVYINDDRLEIQTIETEDGLSPNEGQLNLWRQDKLVLYSATYLFYLSQVEQINLDHKGLVAAFPNVEIEDS